MPLPTPPPHRRFPTLGAALRADAGRALAMAITGAAALAVVELVATLWAYPAQASAVAAIRLAALTITLIGLLWLALAPLFVIGVAAPRLWRSWFGDGDARDGAGALAWGPRRDGPPPGVALLWAAALAAGAYVVAVQRVGYYAVTHFKEQQLIALTIAAAALVLAALSYGFLRAAQRAFAVGGELLYPTVGRVSPLTSWPGALIGIAAAAAGLLAIALAKLPQLRPLVPWRLLLAATAIGAGMALGARLVAHGPLVAPARRRRVALAAAAVALVLVPSSLLWFGAEHETRSIAVTSSPLLSRLIDAVRRANDFDRDGFGSLLGENDCGPFDAAIRPGVRDLPDNNVDENCDGRDFSLRELHRPKPGESVAVPAPFKRDWNVLLLTIDTVRYDHTTFGGYATGPKKRNTTPNLDKLVKRATSFTFANAPSAGTMASVPAILTSKFFHSGIALDEKVVRGMPPRLKPENTLIAEVMKRGGYRTGAILTHEYFNDWGMNQGTDEYDNSIGKTGDPFRVSSQLVTDRVLAWASRHAGQKWFLWAHYLDPHGRYVAHPEDVDYGTSEEDLYDAELFYTDKHLGRLFDELARLPGGDRTIVVITSDHGDAFNEHGFINHGQALYRELLHVPLIIYVPDNEPRQIGGAVTPLDIVPTVAALAGIDVRDLSFEGQSLVPQIFHGTEEPDRIVFAETNWPKPLRAAVSSKYKLVYNLQNNLEELYDLVADPWEKTNIASRDRAAAATMKDALDRWLERVVYSRDATFNQAASKMSEVLMPARPTPALPITGTSFDGGHLVVLGSEPKAPRARGGEKLEVDVFFEVADRPSGPFKVQIVAWPATPGTAPTAAMPADLSRGPARLTLDGMFPSDRWRKGEFIRERLHVPLPTTWTAGGVVLAVSLIDSSGKRLPASGATPSNDPTLAVLGALPLDPQAPPAPPPAAQPAGSLKPPTP